MSVAPIGASRTDAIESEATCVSSGFEVVKIGAEKLPGLAAASLNVAALASNGEHAKISRADDAATHRAEPRAGGKRGLKIANCGSTHDGFFEPGLAPPDLAEANEPHRATPHR